jgi:hypothetical protein
MVIALLSYAYATGVFSSREAPSRASSLALVEDDP